VKATRGFFVSKTKGHETFCDYYLSLIEGGDQNMLSKYILTLVQHIAFVGRKEAYVQEFLNFPSQTVNSSDPQSKRTLLHHAATINSTDVLELLSRHFSCIDCVDNRGITPAFLAAEHGLVDNLEFLVKRGANVNRKTKSIFAFYKAKVREAFQKAKIDPPLSAAFPRIDMPVSRSKSKFFGASMIHAAAQGGHVHVVRYLLHNNASVSTLNGVHLTAIQLAAENGHLEVVRILHEAGTTADQTALHHAAANNRLGVVDFLLNIGVQDECLRCNGSFYWLEAEHRLPSSPIFLSPAFDLEKKWPDETKKLYDDKHLILCHSALHAAVASGHDKVVTRLLSEEQNALNCYDYTGRTPLHEAVRKKNTKIVNILLEKQPQLIQDKCKHWQDVDKTLLSIDELAEYHADICHCGYTPLHLAARYGHLQLAKSLMIKGAQLDDRDCSGATPIHVAACHNQARFILKFANPNVGGDINSKTLNGSTPLHSAAACGAVEVIDFMLYKKANLMAVDDYGLTALHYSILNATLSPLHIFYPQKGHLSSFFNHDNEIMSVDRLQWLDTLLKLLYRGSHIDAVDIYGRTLLHIAAHHGLADAVNVLLQMKASVEKKDNHGNTPLELAFENTPIESKQKPLLSATKIEDLQNDLHGHEMVVFLLLSYGASCTKCNSSGSSMLHRAIINKQLHLVQLLLLKGASLTCKDKLGRTPLVAYLHSGGLFTDVLLSDFTVSVAIECGKPFNSSAFHLLSYRRPTWQDHNFFHLNKCNGSDDPVCKVKTGPLAEAIESHPRKQRIISSCFDAEGFTPLHRAAQGANVVAIRYLLANGADDSILSPRGHDALTLAVLHAGKSKLRQFHGRIASNGDFLHMIQAEEAAIELLRHAKTSRRYRIICDPSKPELTLYHLAASRGLVELVKVIFNESDWHHLDVDCPNMDGITPVYLAKLFENRVQTGHYNPWEEVIQIIKKHGGEMRYPRKNAELSIIYNGVYGWSPNEFTLDLRPDIFHFITSLLNLYKKRENKSFRCSFGPNLDLTHEKYFYWRVKWIWQEINDTVVSLLKSLDQERSGLSGMCSKEEELFRRDMKRCSRHVKQFHRHLSRIFVHRLSYPKNIAKTWKWEVFSEVQRNWFQKELLNLMKMRHTEVFRSFACAKSLSNRFKPVLRLHDRVVTFRLHQYAEESRPYNYLNSICLDVRFMFEHYLSHMKRNQMPSEARFRHNELFSRPGFVNERMKISIYDFHPSSLIVEWPLEFLLKRSLGLFRRYDYLKTVHVGIEPRTYIPLCRDNIRQPVEQGKTWLWTFPYWRDKWDGDSENDVAICSI